MYSPAMIGRREEALLRNRALAELYPTGLPAYSVAESATLTAALIQLKKDDGSLERRLSAEEERFIGVSRLRSYIDFPYWAERFCNPPEAPIWMADMTMKPIGDVRVGDVVIGWAPLGGARPRGRRNKQKPRDTLVESTVLAVAKRKSSIVRVIMESGREIRCTPDHLWRRGSYGNGGSYTQVNGVRKQYHYPWTEAKVGRDLAFVIPPKALAPVTTPEDIRLAAWLGGIYDGEGSERRIAQSLSHNPLVCQKIAEALKHFDIPFAQDADGFYITGGRVVFARFLAIAQPHRDKPLRGVVLSASFCKGDKIIAVLPDGEGEVVSMQTTTGNYIAWGYASKNCWIDQEGLGLRPLYPLWESQRSVIEQLGRLEDERWRTGHPDGLLINVLKARQLGVSTLSQALSAHRLLTRAHVRALTGADVEEQAGYLFRMLRRLYDQIPWFLQPNLLTFVKNREMTFSNESFVKTAWGKSTRGALATVGGEGSKGAIGRGQTYSVFTISELATWDNPEQLDSALFPAIPVRSEALGVLESTAEFAQDWWHKHWLATGEGDGRFSNIFIPWYVEPGKYSLPAPAGWSPSSQTLQHAAKCERDSPKWLGGRSVTLNQDQLYWYERTRAYYTKKNELHKFLKEYPADDLECFQYAGRAIFSQEQLEQIDVAGSKRAILDIWRVEPAREIAALRREQPAPADGRATPPLSPRLPLANLRDGATQYPVPPGFGFQRVSKVELADLKDLRQGVFTIWEYPRARGQRRYIMSVDVGEGLGQDYSVIDIIRMPTIEEPAEQVAQFVSNKIDTKQLAFVCDAVGRLYPDNDGIEALAAIETNNCGLATQDVLQLHLGYSNFYIWEYADAASPDKRYSTKIGWITSTRTRPFLISAFYAAITSFDPITNQPDLILNSPVTRGELRHFITETGIGDAEAARGQHDDCVMSSAIGYYVGWRLAGGEQEPIEEKRRRRAAQHAAAELSGQKAGHQWRNMPVTAEEADNQIEDDDEFGEELGKTGPSALHFSDSRDRVF